MSRLDILETLGSLMIIVAVVFLSACVMREMSRQPVPDNCDPKGECNVGKPTQGGNY